jgi:hypothetical protein
MATQPPKPYSRIERGIAIGFAMVMAVIGIWALIIEPVISGSGGQ